MKRYIFSTALILFTLISDLVATTTEEKQNKGLVFLFQGNSITDGNRGRNEDPNHIMGHGYAFAIPSRIGADFPEDGHTFYNRGISGNRVIDLQNRWKEDALDLKPDILSILIGINDVNGFVDGQPMSSLEDFENIYRNILVQSKEANPDILFVLGLPFVKNNARFGDNWNKWKENTLQREKIIHKLAKEFDAIIVDYPTVFDQAEKIQPIEYWIWDGIHPTVFGHELMAREWIKQVSERLIFLKRYNY